MQFDDLNSVSVVRMNLSDEIQHYPWRLVSTSETRSDDLVRSPLTSVILFRDRLLLGCANEHVHVQIMNMNERNT